MTIVKMHDFPHPRRIIRHQILRLLLPNTMLGERWYVSRPNASWAEESPSGLIYFSGEESSSNGTRPKTYRRPCEVTTEILMRQEAEDPQKIDDYLDARAAEVEQVFNEYLFLGLEGYEDFIEDVELVRTRPTVVRSDGDSNIASLQLFWMITYLSDGFNYQEMSDKYNEFLSFKTDYKIGAGDTIENITTIRSE